MIDTYRIRDMCKYLIFFFSFIHLLSFLIYYITYTRHLYYHIYDFHTAFIRHSHSFKVVCDDKTNSGSTFFHGSVFCSLCTDSNVADEGLEVEEMVVM